jgi:Domain of unknown function (DUF3492)
MPHTLQALGGLVVQRKENQALLIWDHGVLMREKVTTPFKALMLTCQLACHPSTAGLHDSRNSWTGMTCGCSFVVFCVKQVIYWDCLESRALPQFVREQLIRLHRVTGQCLYAAADFIIPCNATFNTKWEVRNLTDHPSQAVSLPKLLK